MHKNKKAIVTILLGDRFVNFWKLYSEKNWRLYSERHGYDIVIFDAPLDKSERAQRRSPSWQRCLIFQDERLKNYEQVVWVDSDILINYISAPCIVSEVPVEKIGGIDAYSFYTKEVYNEIYKRYVSLWKKTNSKAIVNTSPKQYYSNWGLMEDVDAVMECGVLVLNKTYHKDLLEMVYHTYEDKGGPEWNYEMRPLSYEIVKNNYHHFIDTRFNYLYPNFLALNYPFLNSRYWKNKIHRKFFRLLNNYSKVDSISIDHFAANTAYMNSYFLHFAGCAPSIQLVDTDIIIEPYYKPVVHGLVKF